MDDRAQFVMLVQTALLLWHEEEDSIFHVLTVLHRAMNLSYREIHELASRKEPYSLVEAAYQFALSEGK